MKYELITPPVGPAVPLATAKQHLVLEHSADDDLVTMYIGQASAWCASYSGRAIGEQEWAVYGDTWCDILSLPFSPLESVVVEYIDADENTQTLPDDQYYLDNKSYPATLRPRPTVNWPELSEAPNCITVTCQVGKNTQDGNIAAAIYLLVGHLYEQRSESAPINIHKIPHGVTTFLDLVRLVWVV